MVDRGEMFVGLEVVLAKLVVEVRVWVLLVAGVVMLVEMVGLFCLKH